MTRDTWEETLRQHRRWLVPLVLVAILIPYGLRASFRPRSAERGDTRFYLRGAGRYWRGADLYYDREAVGDPHADPRQEAIPTTGYTYLPPFAALNGWMVLVPYRALRSLWLVLMLACAALAVRVAWRVAQPRAPPAGRPHLVTLLALLVTIRFGLNDLAHGQVNWLLTLLLGLTLLEAKERPARAGAWLAGALLIKPTAWLLLPWYAVVDRRPRLVTTCLAVGAAALLLVGLRYGAAYPTQLGDWALRMSRFADEAAQVPENVSLSAAFIRLGAGVEREGVVEPLLAARPVEAVRFWARLLTGLLVGGAFLALARWRRRAPAAPALVILLGALLSPVTWKAHLVALLLSAVFLARRLAEDPVGPRRWLCFAGLLAMLVLPTHSAPGLDTLLECGALTLAVIALGGWTAWSAREVESPP